MIYKMTLKDSVDTMTFNLLETPIVDKDIEGAVDNVTLDGNQYTDYLYLKKQYIQKWSIMCDEEYERLRGFYTRQFDEAEIPTYELYYGETIYNDYTLSGEYILADIQGVEPARMSLARLNGNATQTTYSGKNLFDGVFRQGSWYNLNTSNRLFTTQELLLTAGQTYTISVTGLPSGFRYAIAMRSIPFDGTGTPTLSYDSGWKTATSFTFTPSSDGYYGMTVSRTNEADITPSSITGMTEQLELGSTATSYEQYVGGTPAPNPEFPMPISVVTGENVVKVVGKNLLDPSTITDNYDFTYDATTGYLTGKTGKWTPYTIFENAINPVIMTATVEQPVGQSSGLGIQFIYADGTYNSIYPWNFPTQDKVVVTSNKPVVSVQTVIGSATNVVSYRLQLEAGSTATAYEPYQGQEFTIDLGSIELAKIGTYQDRIYKDGEKWYIEKQVGKVDLATLTWQNLGGLLRRTTGITDIKYVSANTELGAIMAEKYTPHIGSGMSATSGCIAVDVSAVSTTDSTGTPSGLAYYALATPTTTEITNQTLIDQLEALINVSVATGIHNIFTEVASGNLHPTMIFNFIEVVSRRVELVPETPVRLTLTDGGIINACGCRKDVQLTMRETIE